MLGEVLAPISRRTTCRTMLPSYHPYQVLTPTSRRTTCRTMLPSYHPYQVLTPISRRVICDEAETRSCRGAPVLREYDRRPFILTNATIRPEKTEGRKTKT